MLKRIRFTLAVEVVLVIFVILQTAMTWKNYIAPQLYRSGYTV